MQTRSWISLSFAAVLAPLAAQEPKPAAAPAAVDTPAAVVAKAVAVAKDKNRRVLVTVFGDDTLSQGLAAAMKTDRKLGKQLQYEFAIAALKPTDTEIGTPGIDLGKAGVPSLFVLDGDGKRIAEFAAVALLPADGKPFAAAGLGKLLEPLHCKPLDAESLLADALSLAKKEQKNLLIHFDAPW